MAIAQFLLGEFDMEMANTRKTLERVPDEKMGWTPHPKSFPLGTLARHLSDLPGWVTNTVNRDDLDLSSFPGYPAPEDNRQKDLLANFDRNVGEARAALAAASDETMLGNWSLLRQGVKLMTLPRIAVVRSFAMNHIIHHRAQLGVYLRLLDIPVPSIYGPSADERPS